MFPPPRDTIIRVRPGCETVTQTVANRCGKLKISRVRAPLAETIANILKIIAGTVLPGLSCETRVGYLHI